METDNNAHPANSGEGQVEPPEEPNYAASTEKVVPNADNNPIGENFEEQELGQKGDGDDLPEWEEGMEEVGAAENENGDGNGNGFENADDLPEWEEGMEEVDVRQGEGEEDLPEWEEGMEEVEADDGMDEIDEVDEIDGCDEGDDGVDDREYDHDV